MSIIKQKGKSLNSKHLLYKKVVDFGGANCCYTKNAINQSCSFSSEFSKQLIFLLPWTPFSIRLYGGISLWRIKTTSYDLE